MGPGSLPGISQGGGATAVNTICSIQPPLNAAATVCATAAFLINVVSNPLSQHYIA